MARKTPEHVSGIVLVCKNEYSCRTPAGWAVLGSIHNPPDLNSPRGEQA